MLLDELDTYVSKELGVTLKEYRYTNIGGKMIYLEGQRGIVTLTNEEVSFKLKTKTFTIKGTDLFIKYYDNNTALVYGSIVSVVVL